MLKNFLIFSLLSLILTSCGAFKPKKVNTREVPISGQERARKNVEEGRGIKFGKRKGAGGTFDFASSNELWRASIEVLDFVPFTNASYSGGILITEWFDGNSSNENIRDLKITVRFLSNEIRSDALKISIHEKLCENNSSNCSVKKISSNLEREIKIAILKRAALLEKNARSKDKEKFKKSGKRVITGPSGN